jgi:maltose alpha-D-glucosyltransferase/alpha-amylase
VPVAGSIEYVADDARSATVALVQAYVSNQGDGWSNTLDYLDRFFDELPSGSGQANGADLHGGYLALARTLGQRTAELHAAFAAATADPAFAPEPVVPADVAAWTQRVRGDAIAALDRLDRRLGALPETVRAEAERLLARRDALLSLVSGHASDAATGAKTRLHGDYHLGQVLLAQNDFVITDFEGEPTRPLAERVQKHSPLKDVAGMLRSFDYAMHTALFDASTEVPDSDERLRRAAREWRALAQRAFLDGYDAAAEAAGLVPAGAQRGGLLELFTLEKAVYELGYEVDNRPDWVRIPLRGLMDILDRSS